jgi:predicted DNA-binding protein
MSITLELPLELESRLEALSKNAGESPETYILRTLENLMEDIEDYDDAVRVSALHKSGKMKTWTLQEVMDRLGLES